MTINGDYLWLENLTIEHATPEGLRVNTSATGTVLKRITALAAIVNLRGVNTLAEDLNVSHVIRQRTDPSECYDANPSFGVGECWNANGIGQALAIGVDDSSSSRGQVVRRAYVHRSWNGAGISGPNTLEHSRLWGFPNHTLGGSGTGTVIRHNVFLNGQDSIYISHAFDDLTVENNVFFNAVLFWVEQHRPRRRGSEVVALSLQRPPGDYLRRQDLPFGHLRLQRVHPFVVREYVPDEGHRHRRPGSIRIRHARRNPGEHGSRRPLGRAAAVEMDRRNVVPPVRESDLR